MNNKPYRVICGDALKVLRKMPSASVHCCVTSPPYYGLRDYKVDGQIGLEKTPAEYIARMVEVFREVRRVLRADGVCWVNIGDSYNSNTQFNNHGGLSAAERYHEEKGGRRHALPVPGLKCKDLIGIRGCSLSPCATTAGISGRM